MSRTGKYGIAIKGQREKISITHIGEKINKILYLCGLEYINDKAMKKTIPRTRPTKIPPL